jgi:hypothetical protein
MRLMDSDPPRRLNTRRVKRLRVGWAGEIDSTLFGAALTRIFTLDFGQLFDTSALADRRERTYQESDDRRSLKRLITFGSLLGV